MRLVCSLSLAIALSGCALPAAVSVATLAADVGSYMISGKTVADHGLSLALDQDCAMLRVFEGGICEDEPDYQVAVATLAPLPDNGADLDISMAAESAPATWETPPVDDPWGLTYGIQLASRPDPGDPVGGDYLAAAFFESHP